MTVTEKSKWYDSKPLLIILLFVLPPLGIVGIFKRNSATWKKIVYTLVGIAISLCLLICTLALIFPVDYYKEGNEYYNQKNYTRAYEYFSKVESSNPNYNDAVSKMQELKPIVDSLNLVEEQREIAEQQYKTDSQREKELLKEQEKREKEMAKNPLLSLPNVQQQFVSVIQECEKEYEKAPNELKKSGIKTKRGNLIKEVLGNSRNFNNWICIVTDMSTTGQGNASFSLKIESTKIQIGNMNNELSDLFDNTLIEQSNPLYDIISELKKGDKVKISGSFLKSPHSDYIFEVSLTENGSMQRPNFVVKFESIEKQ
ncbi:MAG: hypothetical protein RL662_2248 [Bacteroidota bacterium]|jgi:tetratricopeptide (TPR) repeat protein